MLLVSKICLCNRTLHWLKKFPEFVSFLFAFIRNLNITASFAGAHGGAVGWGTALQVGRSRVRFQMVSLELFIDIILGWTQPLTKMSTRNTSWGVKAAGAYGWQPYHLHVLIVLKSGSPNLLELSGPVQACNGIALLLPASIALGGPRFDIRVILGWLGVRRIREIL
jgi:hypothetical protein